MIARCDLQAWQAGLVSLLAWDHNTYYQSRLLRALPGSGGRVLDVGCGAGAFAVRLAQRADCVDALDRLPAMIAAAQRRVPENDTCVLGDVCEVALPAGGYDAITTISALHHMPLPRVLPRLAAALCPGGVLVAVAHHWVEFPRDLLVHAVSTLLAPDPAAGGRRPARSQGAQAAVVAL